MENNVSIKNLVKQALIKKENKAYLRRLQQRQVTYPDWVAKLEADWTKKDAGFREERVGQQWTQPENSTENSQAEEDFVVICASEGSLSKNALRNIGCYFLKYPKVQLLYGDEDVWPESSRIMDVQKERGFPWFKPDWSPDLLDSCLYFGSVTALRKELFDKVQAEHGQLPGGAGQKFLEVFRKGNRENVDYEVKDFAAYREWLHNCLAFAGAYEKGSAVVGHVPRILFHAEDPKEQLLFFDDTPLKLDTGNVQKFRKCRPDPATQKSAGAETGEPVVSVVIPSKDQPEVLEKCLRGCRLAGGIGYENSSKDYQSVGSLPLEVLLVDNGSSQHNREKVERMVRELDAPNFRIRYLYQPMEFNFSQMCNLGAEQARGEFLLFLNDDVELCLPGCIETMAALAGRLFTGAVGMKLLYPKSTRIQHAGITNLPMGPVHKLQFLDDNTRYYYGANRGYRNVLAVTAACLMVARDKFLEAGSFAEELQVAFNDVDLCFRLHELGYWNVCINDMYAYHYESLSRGDDESTEKLERLFRERDRLYGRHPQLAGVDPFYSVHLNREGLDTRIRPAYVTACNRFQQVKGPLGKFDPAGSRQDPCLLVRIEECRIGRLQGYGVVLGDNNACYEMRLLFRFLSQTEMVTGGEVEKSENDNIYVIKLAEQHRPDLEENMPDQVNVALSGFAVELKETVLPTGRYQLGLAARNRVTGLRLVNWSNRYLVME